MKNRKSVFYSLLLLVLVFCLSGSKVTKADEQIDFPLKDASGVKAFGILHDEFLADDLIREGLVKDFYDCYGGAYLDDRGNLTVYYQRGSAEAAALTKEYVDGIVQDDIPFVPVDYSYLDLLDLQYRVLEMKETAIKNGASTPLEKIQSVGICQKDNCLRLMTDALSNQEVNALTKLLENIPFKIEAMDGAVYSPETTVNPGNAISTGGSIGFRAKVNGSEGFITAIHSSTTGGSVSSGSTPLGTTQYSFYDSGVDFCFVITPPSYGNSVSIYPLGNTSYPVISSYTTSLPQNWPVYFAGRNASYIRSGTVYDYDNGMGTTYNHWILCDYTSSSGDSGGCIFTYLNGFYRVVGVHDGSYGSATSPIHRYGTKVTTMITYLSGLTLY